MQIARLSFVLALILAGVAAGARGEDDPLKILVSVEQPSIVMPFPARATLHYHNSGKETLWLYRPVRGRAKEGASLNVQLESLEVIDPSTVSTPAEGGVFERAGFPRPKLIRLAPGEDLTEKTTLKLLPARTGEGAGVPVWGRYRLSLTYSVLYSNSAFLWSETASVFWQGESAVSPIEVELQPPAGEGIVSGTVQGAQGQLLPGVLLTLSGEDERPIDQMVTEGDGRYAFDRLPPGTYWVTARRPSIHEDTTVFRHVILTPAAPNGTIDLLMVPPETYEPKGLLHKPLLLLVTDGQDSPVGGVTYENVWTTGKVIESIKGVTESDGRAALELLPGRSFVTLKRKGCQKAEHRVDVEASGGVDGVKLAIECATK